MTEHPVALADSKKLDGSLTRRSLVAVVGAIAVTPARAAAGSVIRLEDMGGKPAPGFDNSEALRRAFAAAAHQGGTVSVGAGTFEIASGRLANSGAIVRPSGVTLVGAASARTTLRITGQSVFNYLFDASGSSDVLTRALRIEGAGVASEESPYACGLMRAALTAHATKDMNDIMFVDCDISNFGSAAWVHIDNQSARLVVRRVGSSNCRWRSAASPSPGLSSILFPGHFLYFYGVTGPIEDVRIDDILMDASQMKGGVALIGDVVGGHVRVETIANAGKAATQLITGPDGAGAYAMLLYAKGPRVPRQLTIDIGTIEAAESVGLYIAGAQDLSIHIGTASGQRDTRDATLLKGVLALLRCRNIVARIDTVVDCARVVEISIDSGTAPLGNLASLDIDVGMISSRPGAIDVTITASGEGRVGGVRLRGHRSGPAACGVAFRTDAKTALQDIDIRQFVGDGAALGVSIEVDVRSRSERLFLGL